MTITIFWLYFGTAKQNTHIDFSVKTMTLIFYEDEKRNYSV